MIVPANLLDRRISRRRRHLSVVMIVIPSSPTLLNSRNEIVLHRIIRLESSLWIPAQTPRDEIEERFVIALQRLLQRLGTRSTSSSFRGDCQSRLAEGIEKQLLATALFDQMLLGRTENLHDACKLLLLVFSGEDRIARV